MKEIRLTEMKNYEYEHVKTFVNNGSKNIRHLAGVLHCSVRKCYNLIKIYKEQGKVGFVHGNTNREPSNKASVAIRNEILEIYESIQADININHFRVVLERDYGIRVSYCFLYNLLNTSDYISPKAHRKTVKAFKKRIIEKEKQKQNLNILETKIIEQEYLEPEKAHPRKERMKYFGELLQLDASLHYWFGKDYPKCQLHAAIDDATGKIVGLYFDVQETLFGYYQISKQFFEKYGIPANILTDNRTVFDYNMDGKKCKDRGTFTNYGFMCHRLGINLMTSSVPETKGRVERLFQTLQSRLVTELSLRHITTIDEANKYLPQFIEDFNNEFSLPYNDSIYGFEKPNKSFDYDEFLTWVYDRTILGGYVVKFYDKTYQIKDNTGKIVCPLIGTKILVVKQLSGLISVLIGDKQYALVECKTRREHSNLDHTEKKEKKVVIPPWNHPWKITYYTEYLNRFKKYQRNNYSYDI